jgi:hypothetical protein
MKPSTGTSESSDRFGEGEWSLSEAPAGWGSGLPVRQRIKAPR